MNKINISESEKNIILEKHNRGISIRQIEKEHDYSFTFIQKLINIEGFQNKIQNNYPLISGKRIVAVCKKTNKKIYDYRNTSGTILNHIKDIYPNIKIESNYKRKSLEYNTGKFWYHKYFYFNHENIPEQKKCFYCDWTTEDINNLSGAYEKHLSSNHNVSLNNYLIDNPKDREYFKKEIYHELVECKICNKKLKIINDKHLKKHNISVADYKIQYDNNIVSKDSIKKLKTNYEKYLKDNSFIKSSSLEEKVIDNLKGVDFQKSNRKILNGLELDLYSNEHNIAIEVNGCLFHTEIFGKKDRKYHLNKTIECEKQDIKLIHIFEDELQNDNIFNKLQHIFSLNDSTKIYARKTTVKKIDNKHIKSDFFNQNHIQGNDTSQIAYGLYYNSTLVAVMSFTNKRNMNKEKNHNDNVYELTRYATALDYIVVGGASKLLSKFVLDNDPKKIISFADRRWSYSKNNLYTKLGFKLDKIIPPDYSYYNPKYSRYKRYHKFGFGKSSIKNKFPDIYSPNLTEWEMMQIAGFDRIWDSGKLRYILEF